MISVLLQGRLNLFSKRGGDTTQIVDLKRGLALKGCKSDISTELKPCLKAYDIVHLFNITRVHDTYVQMLNAKQQGKPVVCTAIYHDLEEYNRKGRYGLGKIAFKLTRNDERLEYVRGLFTILRDRSQISPVMSQWKLGYRAQQEAILRQADKIIFASSSEKGMVLSRFRDIHRLIDGKVIKIGLKRSISKPDPRPFEEKYGVRDFILCVGRIEDLKNQMGLLSAMKGEDIPLVLIGSLNPAHQGYCRNVLREVKKRDNLYYLGPMERPTLMSAFAAAKVHVLPSWFETTGLANLEAGLADCNVVSTNRGYARDYLRDYAWYCDPSDPLSIRTAVRAAYDSPTKSGFKDYIHKELDIEKMLEHFMELYASVLTGNR